MDELTDGLKDKLVEGDAELPSLEEIKERCVLIQTAVDEAIGLAREKDGSWKREPINWADLNCVDVDFVVNWNGFTLATFYRATIEEAAPECMSLHSFIQNQLAQRGIGGLLGGVEIRTEW